MPPALPRPSPPDTDLIESGGRVDQGPALQLRVVDGPDYGLSTRLNGVTVIGTSPQASLVLTDSTVSRRHVVLIPGPHGIEVQDLQSKNGVFQSGARLVHGHITVGAEIVVGRTVIRIDGPDVASQPSKAESRSALHGNSTATRQLRNEIARAARVEGHVLIVGERGTGRSRVARAVHEQSAHKDDSFVVLPASSLDRGGIGARIKLAQGSVLLVEIDELSTDARRALLDELEGDRIRVRLLVSTVDPAKAFGSDRVDQELSKRLSAIQVRVPPLRERASDLPALISVMLSELGHTKFRIGPEALGQMQAHSWPDNLRELKSFLVQLIERERTADPAPNPRRSTETMVGADLPYKEARARMIQAFEREYAQSLLDRTGGNVSKAARQAGIDRVYLHRLIKKYGLGSER